MIWGVSIPLWDALSQYTFYGPWIESFQDCWWDPEFPQLSQMVQSLPGFLNLCAVQVKSSEMFTPRHLKLLSAHPLHRGPTDHLEGDLCPPEDMSAAVSMFTSGACSAAVVWQETERVQGVCWGSCVPAYGYCVIAGHITPNDRWEGFCPVCHGRLALGADGERVELFLCVWVLFISLNSSHESRSLFSFLSILYFPLFFIGSLSPALVFVLLPDAGKHTHTYIHTHTRAQSRLLVPVLSSQVLIGSGSSNVQMINGLRIWRRSPPPPPHPFLPSPGFSSFSPKPIYVWMQDHTHTHTQPPNAGEGRPSLSELCFVTRAAAVLSRVVLGKARALRVEGLPRFIKALARCCRGLPDRMWNWRRSRPPPSCIYTARRHRKHRSHIHALKVMVETCDEAVKVSADGQAWIRGLPGMWAVGGSKVRVPVPSGRREALCVQILVHL